VESERLGAWSFSVNFGQGRKGEPEVREVREVRDRNETKSQTDCEDSMHLGFWDSRCRRSLSQSVSADLRINAESLRRGAQESHGNDLSINAEPLRSGAQRRAVATTWCQRSVVAERPAKKRDGDLGPTQCCCGAAPNEKP
jgi:hypothetical protein